MSRIVYKICPHSLWQNAEKDGVFTGAPVDHADGFIHFSTAEQVQQTAKLHFGGATDLVLLAVDSSKLGSGLVYEKSRGGALFPHLYGAFNFDAVCWVKPLPLAVNGIHEFPDLSACSATLHGWVIAGCYVATPRQPTGYRFTRCA